MAANDGDGVSIGVTAFKAHCLAPIDEVARGKASRVLPTKQYRLVAAIVPVDGSPAPLWRALRGTVTVSPDTDLTQGTGDLWEVDR